MSDRVKAEAVRIYKILAAQSFEDCYALTTSFKELPRQPGLYAIRNRTDVLYVGKALNVRGRFKTGHTALVTAFINGLSPADIRIAVVTLSPYWVNSLDELESWMIAESKPRYNSRLPSTEVKKIMQLTNRVTILDSLPPTIRQGGFMFIRRKLKPYYFRYPLVDLKQPSDERTGFVDFLSRQ